MKPLPPVSTSIWFWITFHIGVFIALAVDLASFKRRHRALSMRAATLRSLLWVVLSLGFSLVVAQTQGPDRALDFLTGYLIEYSLSVDNIFVFVLIFSYFKVPEKHQHRVLFWGIIGALVLRGTMILAGAALVAKFEWILYIFGVFLVFTGLRMAFQKSDDVYDAERDPVLRLVRRLVPVTSGYREEKFFVKEKDSAGRLRTWVTPLFIVLVLVDTTDVIFATDSIPAIFAVTRNPFVMYTSNICAVLGLRALYFVLASVVDKFRWLKLGLSLVLIFIGAKMLIEPIF